MTTGQRAHANIVTRLAKQTLAHLRARHSVKYVRPLHAPDFPLVLLFSPKAGCTSLTKWFFFQTGKLDAALAYNRWVHKYRTEVFQRQPGYAAETKRLLRTRERMIVKLVRNPYERAVSSFLQVVRNANLPTQRRDREMALVRAARERAGKPHGDALCLSFRDFMRHVAAVGISIGKINSHIAQQYLPSEENYVSLYIKLENFAEEIKRLEVEFGLDDSPLEDFRMSKHHNDSDATPAVAWKSGQEAKLAPDVVVDLANIENRNLPGYRSFYDEETERLVYTCYGDDFRQYGYARMIPHDDADQSG